MEAPTGFEPIYQLTTARCKDSNNTWTAELLPALELSDLSVVSPASASSHICYTPLEYATECYSDRSPLIEKHESRDYTSYQSAESSGSNGMTWTLQWNPPEPLFCGWEVEHKFMSIPKPWDFNLANESSTSILHSGAPDSISSPGETQAMLNDKKRKYPVAPSVKGMTTQQSFPKSPHKSKDPVHGTTITKSTESFKKSHNLVEKQYRQRLNEQFAQLQAKMPRDMLAGNESLGVGRKMTKTGTLEKAQQYIKILQDQEQALLRSNRELAVDMERLEEQLRCSGNAPAFENLVLRRSDE